MDHFETSTQELLRTMEFLSKMLNTSANSVDIDFRSGKELTTSNTNTYVNTDDSELFKDIYNIYSNNSIQLQQNDHLNNTPSPTTTLTTTDDDDFYDHHSLFDYEDTDSIDDNLLDEILFDDACDMPSSPMSNLDYPPHMSQQTPQSPTYHPQPIQPETRNALVSDGSSLSSSEDEDEEHQPRTSVSPRRRRPQPRPLAPKKTKRRRRSNLMKPGSQLYQFILQLLDDEENRELIRWEKPSSGIFRIMNKEKVAKMWGDARNRKMTYDSLSRGLRHYYSQGLLNAVNKKLHYQFTQKALAEWEVIRNKESIEER